MKQVIRNIVFVLIFLAGLGVLLYPTVSNQWNNYRQSKLINHYQEMVNQMEKEDFTAEWQRAERFNTAIEYNALYTYAFGADTEELEDTEYWNVLNVVGDGIMGYLSIPDINVKLAIYHGTSESALQTGVGHINGTNLPIGGETNHSVLAAHRGLPTAKLFTDIDQLETGDLFYIHIFDKVLSYQVDCIHDMVDKNDAEALGAALAQEEAKDYVTLFTCTPYGVNSHRLLVRGVRVDSVKETVEEIEIVTSEKMLEAVQNDSLYYMILGLAFTVLTIVVMKSLFHHQKKNKRSSNVG